jgi:hypothetical protein
MTSPDTGLTAANGGSRISEPVAQQLIGTYRTEEGWPPDKTRAVWLSLASIIDIQALIEENDGDGIRIYFGKYPSDTDIAGTPDPAYKGKVTLVLIPTITGTTGSHDDIFPPTVSQTVPQNGGQAYNHGSLCPPNCGQTPPPPPGQS